MSRRAELARHVGAFGIAVLGTLGVFGLSLGMNAQVEKKVLEPVSVIETLAVAPQTKNPAAARQRRASLAKKSRSSAPSPAPLLSASLGDLDFGLGDAADAALSGATDALVGNLGGAVMNEESVEVAPVATDRTPPSFPARARALGLSGQVTLSFVVDIDGSAQDVHAVESTPPGVFDEAAIEAARAWRFEPGRDQGTPVAVRVRQILRFELE